MNHLGRRAGFFDQGLAVRVDQPDDGILAAVKDGCDLKFDRDRVLVQLRHRQGQRCGIVIVLDGQLLLQIVARCQHAGHEAASEGDQGAGDDCEPDLSE